MKMILTLGQELDVTLLFIHLHSQMNLIAFTDEFDTRPRVFAVMLRELDAALCDFHLPFIWHILLDCSVLWAILHEISAALRDLHLHFCRNLPVAPMIWMCTCTLRRGF